MKKLGRREGHSVPRSRSVIRVEAVQEAAQPLLDWYVAERRDLPWRRDRDPYRILVSEVMLQQTRVDVVLPRFERFLQRFPTVEALALASEEVVLAEWSGLGYYRRARSLQAAARHVLEQCDGSFPRTIRGLLEMPGVGPYTAAALGSIAFDLPEPVLDGNVERVLSRCLRSRESPKKAAVRRQLVETARSLLVEGRPGDSNQALMELGATVCLPRRWDCTRCPLERICAAAAAGDQDQYPARVERRKIESWRWTMFLIRRSPDEWLLERRPEAASFLPAVWLPPGDLTRVGATAPTTRRDGAGHEVLPTVGSEQAERLARWAGAPSWELGRSGILRHQITHRRIEVEVVELRLDRNVGLTPGQTSGQTSVSSTSLTSSESLGSVAQPEAELAWHAVSRFDALPTSSLLSKVVRLTTAWPLLESVGNQ